MIELRLTVTLLLSASLVACFGNDVIDETCDEPQAYQAVTQGKRIDVPDGLDPLEEFKEMPVPKSENEPRPAGSKCIDSVPSVISGTDG